MISVYNFIAYALGTLIGEGKRRILSAFIFWLIMQIAGVLIEFLAFLIKGPISPGPPNPLDFPYYFLAYLLVSMIHLKYYA